LNNLMTPADFPRAVCEEIHLKILPFSETRNAIYSQYLGATIALSYRFRALTDYSESFTASIISNAASRSGENRFKEERDLFGFFSNASSTFDAFFYSMFAIGAFFEVQLFPLASPDDERAVSANSTIAAYKKAFPNDPVIAALKQIVDDDTYKDVYRIRNILTHRSAPGRTFSVAIGNDEVPPDQWKVINIPLDKTTTHSRRAGVSSLLCAGLQAGLKFIESHVS
jgi:hypothetical protein